MQEPGIELALAQKRWWVERTSMTVFGRRVGLKGARQREFDGNTKLNILSCYQNVIRVHENLAVELLSIFCSNAV
jgi:hypothetical protein